MSVDPIVRRLVIKRFRSFPADVVEFANPMILVGHNGAGKSNFADVFAFLAESMQTPLQAVFDRRGGISAVRNRTSGSSGYPPNLGLAVELGALNDTISRGRFAFEVKALRPYGFEVVREQCLVLAKNNERFWFDREASFTANVSGLKPALDPSSLCLPVVGGDHRFAPILRALSAMRRYSIEPSRLREMQDPDSGIALRQHGGNAASVLQELSRGGADVVKRLCEILGSIVPNTTEVRSKKHGNKLSLEFVQEWGSKKRLRFEAFNMSDGTLRAVGLLTAVFQRPAPTLLVIEEPEATIHPGALGAVLDLLRLASRTMQVVVTTHSPELLDAKWIKDEHLRVVAWHEGASHVVPPSDASRKAMREHLMGAGELLRSDALLPQEIFESVPEQGALFEAFA